MAVLTPSRIRRALAQRITDQVGLKEATDLLGPELQPAAIVDRSFSIFWRGSVPTEERVRSGSFHHPLQTVVIRTAHKPNPKAKAADAIDRELDDQSAVRDAILSYLADDLQPIQNTFRWRSTSEPSVKVEGVRLVDHTFDLRFPEAIGQRSTIPATVNPG